MCSHTIVAVLILVGGVQTLDNGLARTPPMGWMHWERYRCNTDCVNDPGNCVSEKLIMQTADAMVDGGFRDAGYQYVAIDDCWMLRNRAQDGRLQADPDRFPSGIKALADYVHSKGLKLGIYGDMGLYTCKRYPGSKFYLQLDAETFATWGVDMLKLDCCWAGGLDDLEAGYSAMTLFLNRTQRPVLYACSWPACAKTQTDYVKVAKHCNMWRNYDDMRDAWKSVIKIINYYGNNTDHFAEIAEPGSWNDPDQLIVGDYGLSYDQERAQMGMWAMMASPLFMSVDLRNIRPSSRALLLNKTILQINQDPLGKQGQRIKTTETGIQIWRKPLMGPSFPQGSFAVAMVTENDFAGPVPVKFVLQDLNITNSAGYQLTEAFDGTDLGKVKSYDKVKVQVNPTGIYMFTATPLVDKQDRELFNIEQEAGFLKYKKKPGKSRP